MKKDCDTCRHYDVDYDNMPCSLCADFDEWESKTNADHIRSMTDEELNLFLCSLIGCPGCRWESSSGCKLQGWLKQPYKEDGDCNG